MAGNGKEAEAGDGGDVQVDDCSGIRSMVATVLSSSIARRLSGVLGEVSLLERILGGIGVLATD